MRSVLSYERLLWRLRSDAGLYLVGAGASAGVAPFARSFWTASTLDFLRNLSSFSAEIPTHSELTNQIIKNSNDITISEIFPDREIRPGTESFPYHEILLRIPNYYARLLLKHLLAKANFAAIQSDNYRVFHLFHPSLIANYNHDGLASRICGHWHRVLDMHGSIERELGSPRVEGLIRQVRGHHLPDSSDGILMGVQESWRHHRRLRLKLLEMVRFKPAFIAIIGYSFARNPKGHDDHVSLAFFENRFRDFTGPVYVIDREPDYLCEMLSKRLKLREINAVRALWNVLAHAFLESMRLSCGRRSINYVYENLLDVYGESVAFPVVHEKPWW